MGVFVTAVAFGVDLGRVAHEPGGVERVGLREQRVVRCLGVIARLVTLRSEFVEIGGGAMVLGGVSVGGEGRMIGHGVCLPSAA